MAITIGRYTFASWLRRGIATRISQVDTLGTAAAGVAERATVPVDVKLNADSIHKEFALIAPGDVIGINPQMVVRTEPLNWITNFEPNYLAFIDFYDEGFVWRYTPARPNGERLRPWLALLVLEQGKTPAESEFERSDRKTPLATVTVKAAAALPPPDQTWAFAHVHINEGHDDPSAFEKFLLSLSDPDASSTDKITSRLLCPRKLKPDTAYHAFVVPAFETGRLAGLGADPSGVDAQQPSWTAGTAGIEFPIYYEWYFRTGANEDFESLVKQLQPRAMDKRVGIRDMDGSSPGFGTTVGTDIGTIPPAGAPQTIIGLEGALKSPTTVPRPVAVNAAKPFLAQLADILNFPAKLKASSNAAIDPVVSPPIYGENHAMRHEVVVAGTGWLDALNRDPRLRVSAGLGTRVVQVNQEDYVARAWDQIKKVLDGNRRLRLGVFAMQLASAMQRSFVAKLSPATLVAFSGAVTKKVKGSPTTIHHQLDGSRLTLAPVDVAFRRLLRPRGPLGRRLVAADSTFSYASLIDGINTGRITASPPKVPPTGIITDDALGPAIASKTPAILRWIIRHFWLVLILLLLLALIALAFGLWALAAVLLLAAIGVVVLRLFGAGTQSLADTIDKPGQLADGIATTPPRPGFPFVETDPPQRPAPAGGTTVTTKTTTPLGSTAAGHTVPEIGYRTPAGAGQDSSEANNFRHAAIKLNRRLSVQPVDPPRPAFDLVNAADKLATAFDPKNAWPRMIAAQVVYTFAPGWLLQPEHLVPAMTYPDFDDPMYEKLRDISSELFLPNLTLIPPNTISLLETNPPFIEAYMTGLNHEFGRELLWREYPTDQRGSYFRQFWSVRGILTGKPGLTEQEIKDLYRDIMPLDQWTSLSHLGNHRNPKRPAGEQLVLVIRGELLKKYPNTLIYAQKAHIYRDKNGNPDPKHEPIIVEATTEALMQSDIRLPVFLAEVAPDLRFFGFDLTIEQARGAANPKTAADDWGWYFVIQELPGEPRFGMDVKFAPDEDKTTPLTWDDLAWDQFSQTPAFVNTANLPINKFMQGLESDQNLWGSHSAGMASILFQKPAMIAVHAKEMLDKLG